MVLRGFIGNTLFWADSNRKSDLERRTDKFVRYRSQTFFTPCNVMKGFIIFCVIDKVPKTLQGPKKYYTVLL